MKRLGRQVAKCWTVQTPVASVLNLAVSASDRSVADKAAGLEPVGHRARLWLAPGSLRDFAEMGRDALPVHFIAHALSFGSEAL
jgi:hypothetical protein